MTAASWGPAKTIVIGMDTMNPYAAPNERPEATRVAKNWLHGMTKWLCGALLLSWFAWLLWLSALDFMSHGLR